MIIDRLPDAAGVRIEEMHGSSRWINSIFGELAKCVKQGMISSGGDALSLVTRAQELMKAGELDEARKLMEQAQKSAMQSIDLANSPAVVDEWIICLEEIDEAAGDAYPVRIIYPGF